MNNLFRQVLQMSITASYVIIAVLALRILLRNAPKKYSYMLWAAVLFRLCCPISFSSVISIFNLKLKRNDSVIIDLSEVPVSAVTPESEVTQPISTGVPQFTEVISGTFSAPQQPITVQPSGTYTPIIVSPPDPGQAVFSKINLMDVLCIIWLAGMLFLIIRAIVSYVRLKRTLRGSVAYRDNIRMAKIYSPFLMGLIRPMIYLPINLDPEYEMISIAHENYHLKRKDHWIRVISYILLCIHWINPFCWLAYYLMGKDMEMSCDEHVLSEGRWSSKAYSEALLSVSTSFRFPSANPVAFGESSVKERIANSMKFKHPNKLITMIATLLCIITLVSCATNGNIPSIVPDTETASDTPDYGTAFVPVDYTVQPGGGEMRSALVGDNGFYGTPVSSGVYYFSHRDPYSSTDRIMFLDYSTGESRCICSDPDCAHSDESCPAYVMGGSNILLATADENHLYMFSTEFSSLVRMDLDGSNRKTLFYVEDHVLDYYDRNSVQTYGNKIYMEMFILGSADDEHPHGFSDLIELDPDMMTYKVVMSLGENTGIAGGFDSRILLSTLEEVYDVAGPPFTVRYRCVYSTFDVTTGKVETINKVDVTDQGYYFGGNLMMLELQDKLYCYCYDFSDGSDDSRKPLAVLPEYLDQEPNLIGDSDGVHHGRAVDRTHFFFSYGEYETDESGELVKYPPLDRPQYVRTHFCLIDTENGTAVAFDDYASSFVFAINGNTYYIVEYDEYYVPHMSAVAAEDLLNGIRITK